MGKTNDDPSIGELVEEIIADTQEDRARLVDFLENLIKGYAEQPAGIAEYVAKISAELTRQNQVKVAAAKTLGKNVAAEDEDEDLAGEIGRPFPEDELDEGSN